MRWHSCQSIGGLAGTALDRLRCFLAKRTNVGISWLAGCRSQRQRRCCAAPTRGSGSARRRPRALGARARDPTLAAPLSHDAVDVCTLATGATAGIRPVDVATVALRLLAPAPVARYCTHQSCSRKKGSVATCIGTRASARRSQLQSCCPCRSEEFQEALEALVQDLQPQTGPVDHCANLEIEKCQDHRGSSRYPVSLDQTLEAFQRNAALVQMGPGWQVQFPGNAQ